MKEIRRWQRSLYKRLVDWEFISPKVVVQMDGGICSQMHQYLLGYLYAQRGCHVSFDLSFFDEWGMDLHHKYVRNFDLLKAFPSLSFHKSSDLELNVYRRKYYTLGNHSPETMTDFSFLERTPPVFLGGYYFLPVTVWVPMFKSLYKLDENILDKENLELCNQIKASVNSVAVHVRRGDLKEELYAYGKPASLEYFQRSVDYFNTQYEKACFYFFSDEPKWVADELVPSLGLAADRFFVVSLNGSDRGYMDLFLIAYCQHQITSKGTLGKYGALLNDNPSKTVILCADQTEHHWEDVFYHAKFL